MGMSCEGFEDQLLVFFTAIEASRNQNGVSSVPNLSVKSANRGNCELKRLLCSLNHNIKGGHSNRDCWVG